jgi:hypothetical protein
MSIWVSLYCQNPVGEINPPDPVAGISNRLDFLEELFAQEEPNEVLSRLRVDVISSDLDSQLLHLQYFEEGPPIVIDRTGNQFEAAARVNEYLNGRFKGREGTNETVLRDHLAKTVESFHFCLKQHHVDGMGMPLVYAAAAWLGKQGNGLLRVDYQGWMKLDGSECFIFCRE